MRVDRWKIFNKKGSNLNPYIDSFLNIEFITDVQNARGADAYAVTDPSSIISEVVVTNSGWNYDPATEAKLVYSFGDYSELLTPAEASIYFKDVSVFDPAGRNSQGISSVTIDVSTEFIYPSVVFSSATFLDPISVGLVETEHLSILEEISAGSYIRPFDALNGLLVFRFTDGDKEIKLFEIDQDTQTLTWSEELVFDVSVNQTNSPLIVNIGFRADDDGVFERKLRIYHRVGSEDFQIAEILVNAQSIGPDERFDILAQDFGLPNPKNIPHLFKRADLNEALPDWELLNYKGKHIILEHDKIMPYIGTYKGLINAIRWLGYEDIKVKEWFRNVKDNTKLSLYVPYEAEDRTKTVLYFTPEERKNLKKLNQLSLIYCITRETGEIDEWGNPVTEDCYEYNINEILIKLKALKEWLEKNIIGVNARITDVTGEGVYFERFQNFIYATQDKGHRATYSQSLTPEFISQGSELVRGEASIGLTLKEIEETKIGKYVGLTIGDFLQYYWDPSNLVFDTEDASALWWDPSTIAVGAPFKFPFYELQDIQWKASVEKTEAGVLPSEFITNPLFVYDNDIKFYNIFDSSAVFFEASTGLNIYIEEGFLRDASNDNWLDSSVYSIYPDPDPSYAGKYIIESSTGEVRKTDGWVNLRPTATSRLEYAFDDNYKVPLLSFKNYKFTDASENTIFFEADKTFYLDILDGKISMKRFIEEPSSYTSDPSTIMYKREDYYINWNYDTSLDEQKITLNVVYTSPRAPLYLYDPSIYYNSGPEQALVFDNSIYIMKVNHIGPYNIEIFGWDTQNNVYRNFAREEYDVWTKFPIIWSYLDTSCQFGSSVIMCPSAMLTVNDISILSAANLYPVFDRQVPLQGLTLEQDVNGKYYLKIPAISYFIDIPESGSIARFYNMTERVVSRAGNWFTVDSDFQSFNNGDIVNIVLFDKGKYHFINEVSGNISGVSGNDLLITGIPAEFITDVSTEVYLLNDTQRATYNAVNDLVNKTLDIDISAYRFEPNQLIGVIIDDVCTGYQWGSSFRVLDSSADNEPSYGYHHFLSGNIPQFILDASSRYTLTAKHSFSTFADFDIDVNYASEISNEFNIYLDDTYYHQYYLDNTFVYVNLLFDQERVIDQWYDPSTDGYLVTAPYYPRTGSITIEPSTLVILDSYFNPSDYMLDQKNIWTVKAKESNEILFRVHNKSVPYIFTELGTWDVQLEAYDRYGNLKTQYFEGLIIVKDE
jgi:hypothetical protein